MSRTGATSDLLARMALDARVRRFAEAPRLGTSFVRHNVAGESLSSALEVTGELLVRGRRVSLAYLGPDPLDAAQARDHRKKLRKLLRKLTQAGYAEQARADISLGLCLLGATLPRDGLATAAAMVGEVAAGAAQAGTRVTVEAEPDLDQGQVIDVVLALREQGADVGVALPASVLRTASDCGALVAAGARVRLDRGQVGIPGAVARRAEADRAYVRCLQVLLAGTAAQPAEHRTVPTISTPDHRLLRICEQLAAGHGLGARDVEYQLRYAERPRRQCVVADRGGLMRVYLPYGPDWYPYLVERIGDRPQDAVTLLRAPGVW